MVKNIKKLFHLCLFTGISLSANAQSSWKIVKQELVFDNPPFKQCHASTIVENKKGEILLSFFGGSQEGKDDVSIWLTQLTGKKAKARLVADGVIDAQRRFPSWNPVLFQPAKGELFLFYKVGPNPREWWGMVKTSGNGGKTWSKGTKLPEGILGPIKNKPVQLQDGTILSPSSIEEKNERWKVHIEKSTDMGKTWEFITVDTTGFDVIQPSILFHKDHKLQLLCRSKQGAVVQAWSSDQGNTWGALSKTELLNPNSGTDAVTLKNGTFLIVYNPDVPGKDWFNGRGKLRVASSTDGLSWEDVVILENGDKEEFSYPAIIQTTDGHVHITYTYDRKNIKHVILKEM